MGNPSSHPYWSQSKQYQQRQGQQRQPGRQFKEGFDPDILGKDVEVKQVKGQSVVVVRGKVEDVSKYWLKLQVGGEVLYLNKAFVISIKPLMIRNAPGGSNAGNGK
jgi:hypothetical protein